MCKKVVLRVSVTNSIREELQRKQTGKKRSVLVQVKFGVLSVAELFAFFLKKGTRRQKNPPNNRF